jgi:hypothetical protein
VLRTPVGEQPVPPAGGTGSVLGHAVHGEFKSGTETALLIGGDLLFFIPGIKAARNASKGTSLAPKGLIPGLLKEGVEVDIKFAAQGRWPFVRSVGHELKWSSEATRQFVKSNPEFWKVFRRHEAVHILDAQKHPLLMFWTKPVLGGRVSLPGGTGARLIAETRAYGIERGAMQIPRIADVFSSIPGRVVVWDGVYTYIVIRTTGLLPEEQE